jgi:hypothetical protein
VNEPIACSLTAEARAEREAWLTRLRGVAIAVRATDGGIVARFPGDPRIESDLHDLARAEAACCPFLELRIESVRDDVELHVSGPAAARPLIEELFAPADV